MPAVSTWHESMVVRAYEAGRHGYAPMPTLCDYLQEAAANHAFALNLSVEQLAAERLTWVLRSLHVRIDTFPRWRERVHLETWPSGHDGLQAFRRYVLTNEAGQTLGIATSAWMLIHIDRRRPVRIPPAIQALELPARPLALPESPAPLPSLPAPSQTVAVVVRQADLDMNQHVNHTNYIAWLSESLPQDFPLTEMQEIEMQFRGEARRGQVVQIHTARTAEPHILLHQLTIEGSQTEVARARSSWRGPAS